MVHERCVGTRAEGNPALNQLLNLRQLLLTSLRLLRASRLGNNQTTRWTIKIVNRTANQKITLSALIRTPWSLIKTFVRVQAPRIHALGSGATTPPPPNGIPPPPSQWYPPTPPRPHPRHSPKPVLLRGPAPAADWGQRNLCGSIFRTRHELQLLNHEGCMAMVMVAAVL